MGQSQGRHARASTPRPVSPKARIPGASPIGDVPPSPLAVRIAGGMLSVIVFMGCFLAFAKYAAVSTRSDKLVRAALTMQTVSPEVARDVNVLTLAEERRAAELWMGTLAFVGTVGGILLGVAAHLGVLHHKQLRYDLDARARVRAHASQAVAAHLQPPIPRSRSSSRAAEKT